jgi:hypothetical protein
MKSEVYKRKLDTLTVCITAVLSENLTSNIFKTLAVCKVTRLFAGTSGPVKSATSQQTSDNPWRSGHWENNAHCTETATAA